MRTPAMLCSVLLHGGAIGVTIAVAAAAGARVERAPRVELLASTASTPAPPPELPAPEVAVEALQAPPLADLPQPPDARLAEADEPDAAAPAVLPPERARPRLSHERVRPATPDVAPSPPLPEPMPVPVPPPAPAAADVDASPCADNPPPEYPPSERALGHEGTVVIAVRVDARGRVLEAELAVPCRHAGLNREALRAVRAWRFEPAARGGAPVEGRVLVPVVFQLRG